jgi:hypothetical protein
MTTGRAQRNTAVSPAESSARRLRWILVFVLPAVVGCVDLDPPWGDVDAQSGSNADALPIDDASDNPGILDEDAPGGLGFDASDLAAGPSEPDSATSGSDGGEGDDANLLPAYDGPDQVEDGAPGSPVDRPTDGGVTASGGTGVVPGGTGGVGGANGPTDGGGGIAVGGAGGSHTSASGSGGIAAGLDAGRGGTRGRTDAGSAGGIDAGSSAAAGGSGGQASGTGGSAPIGTGGATATSGTLGTGGATSVPCPGVVDSSICWQVGAMGATCAATCASRGGTSPNAVSHVGTAAQGGSLAECTRLLALLGMNVTVYERQSAQGFGCHIKSDESQPYAWAGSPAYTDNASLSDVQIVCGCRP